MPPHRFLRTSWVFSATERLDLPPFRLGMRRIGSAEAAQMLTLARQRNVFSRHRSDDAFYLDRINRLSDTTVVEHFFDGDVDSGIDAAKTRAGLLEQVALLSACFGLTRQRVRSLLAVSGHRRFGFDLTICDGFAKLRTSARPEPAPKGIPVSSTFVRRFVKMGFPAAYALAASDHALSPRIRLALTWQAESLLESSNSAAVVKTAIALESLLVANESESLRGPIAERAAFLLSRIPATRRRIAKVLKRFYDLRSSLVHGGRKKATSIPPGTLDGIDRLVALLMLSLAQNASQLASFDAIVGWVDDLRWGGATIPTQVAFPQSHLTRALNLLDGGVRTEAGA